MDTDKLDVITEEGDPSEEIPGCKFDGIGTEKNGIHGMWDPKAVFEARSEEVNFMKSLGAWEEASREECWHNTGREPTTTKWVDVNKGRNGEIQIRSRLVARDFRIKGDERQLVLLAATPRCSLWARPMDSPH